tara:strand:+ start:1311 stop:1991 length:681 start_codon:yes stop_codon:yes gene_type:complete
VKNILVLLLMLGLAGGMTSCSNKKKAQDETVQTEESLDDLGLDDSDFIVDEGEESGDMFASDDEVEMPSDTQLVTEEPEMVSADEQPMTESMPVAAAPEVNMGGSDTYEVQQGETLMWIAFKLYGDYGRWRELQSMNSGVLADGLQPGDRLTYNSNGFRWAPNGLPHLIRSGETLGTISNDKYGTQSKWRKIWDNNRDMIKDPNLIFAGFTLYYVPEERDIASEGL